MHPLLLLALLACADDVAPLDPGDGGSADGGAADGGSADAGTSDGGSGDGGSGDGGSPGDGGTTSDGGADGGADGGTDGGTDGGGDGGAPEEPDPIVRFIAMGDGGEGNADQYAVAAAVGALCAAKTDALADGCDFVLYLGDNFYDDGVDSVDDEQFQSKFELPYAELDLPFMVALGNHDYGELSIYWWKADYQVEYTDLSDKWTMPDKYYAFEAEHASFYALNTNEILLGWSDAEQMAWLDGALTMDDSTWRIAYGHHPYLSNGQHGNAGEYEGYDWLPIANGATVQTFMESTICGQIDVYLSGHDHNRQWLAPQCGTEWIVTGAAAKTTDLVGRGTDTLFEDDTAEGFVWIELRGDTLTGEFYDKDGALEFSRSYTK